MRTLWVYVRSSIQWLMFGFLLCFYVGVIFLVYWIAPSRLESVLRIFGKHMVWVSGIDLHVHGLENVDRSKPYVVMFNHFNFFDHFVIYHALHIRLRGLEKAAHFHWPIYGTFMKQIGIIPIPPRGNTEGAMKALEVAREKLHEGFSILIAPEGTRTLDGKLGKFKKGGFHLAIQTQTDILPLIFKGMYEFNHKHTRLLRPGRVDLTIEPSISTKGMTDNDVTSLRDKVRKMYEKHYS